jgi:hypothetical protein
MSKAVTRGENHNRRDGGGGGGGGDDDGGGGDDDDDDDDDDDVNPTSLYRPIIPVRTDAAAVIWGDYLIVFGGLTNETHWCPDSWFLNAEQKTMTAKQLKVLLVCQSLFMLFSP